MTQDRPILGIALMLAFCLLAPLSDSLAKLVGPVVGVVQLILLRFTIQTVILAPLTLGRRRWHGFHRATLGWIALRSVLHVAGGVTMIAALLYLPLADAIAIAYVMPFILLLLGHWFLGEVVGWRRILACAIGFGGTLLILQPAFDAVGWPALLPVLTALLFALFMLVTRKIAGRVDALAMQTVSGGIAMALLVPVIAVGSALSIEVITWRDVPGAVWALVLAMGVVATIGHLFMTWALNYAPTATLAPIQYAEIPAAAALGWLIFAEVPGPMAAMGIAITIGAGLFIILHERSRARAIAAGLQPAPRDGPAAG